MATSGLGPWGTAQQRLGQNARLDRHLADSLQELAQEQALDGKLAWAIESGRVYGLRQQKCYMRLERQLNRNLQRWHITQPTW